MEADTLVRRSCLGTSAALHLVLHYRVSGLPRPQCIQCPGLEAKYRGLQVISREGQLLRTSVASTCNDATDVSEPNDSMPNPVDVSKDEETSPDVPPHTSSELKRAGEPEQGTLPVAPESAKTGQHEEATENLCIGGSSTSSTATCSPHAELGKDQGNDCDWAACVTACKGRLNRMLLGCGMPSLPCQVGWYVRELNSSVPPTCCMDFGGHPSLPNAFVTCCASLRCSLQVRIGGA